MSTWLIAKSASVVTEVCVVEVLFPELGSLVAEVTFATAVSVPVEAGALITMVILGAAPTASEARVQVTTPPEAPQVHPEPVIETRTALTGS